jgi:integrase
VSDEELLELMLRAEGRLGDARSASTWSDIASVLNQFASFDAANLAHHLTYELQPLELRMMYWVEHKLLAASPIDMSTAVEYYRKLHAAFRLLNGAESTLLKEYGAALSRNPEAVPEGARAMQPNELQQALAALDDHVAQCQLTVQWVTASRSDDLHRLTWDDVTTNADGSTTLAWNRGTKSGTTKRQDFLPPTIDPEIRRYLSNKAGPQPFPLDAAAMTRALRRVLDPDPRLTSHSVKKGALTTLLRRGVPLTLVQFKAKHSSLETLQTYVGAEVWAQAHRAVETSELLLEDCRPPPR